MAERKTSIKLFGKEQSATEVPIVNARETASEYELEDGSLIRVRFVTNAVLRIDDEWDGDGNPIYFVRNGIATTVLEPGEKVKKRD